MLGYEVFGTLLDGKPIMALDFGRKRIGIAFSDVRRRFAVPHSVLIRKRHVVADIESIYSLYTDYCACLLVIGLPYDHIRGDGWVEEIEGFAVLIKKKYGLPIYFQDESYTTAQAEMILGNFSNANKKKSIDKISACCILEHTLSIMNFYNEQSIFK